MRSRISTSSDSGPSFFVTKEQRDARCAEKDVVTRRVFDKLTIRDPRAFTAVLMPSLNGPEVGWLLERGVPRHNLFAIERTRETHTLLVKHRIPTTPRPMCVQAAIDHVPHDRVSLAYLDFYGQPNGDHLEAMRKLFRLHMREGSRLWVTFGTNRGKTFSCSLNRRVVNAETAGEAYVRAAHALVDRAVPIRHVVNHRYKTSSVYHPANYILTEVHL